MNCANKNISFTSRCQEIELARAACRKVTLYSPSKSYATVSKLRQTNQDAMEFFENMRNCDYETYGRRNKVQIMLDSWLNCNKKIKQNREIKGKNNVENVQNLFDFVNKTHLGNCGEYANSILPILKMNGIKNAYTTTLKNGNKVDHEICIFNRDGSKFDGKIKNNKTIIVDAWLGVVDFAHNALKEIRKLGQKHFFFNSQNPLTINSENIGNIELSEKEIKLLREKYPEFIINKKWPEKLKH